MRYANSHRTIQALYEAAHAVLTGVEPAETLSDPLAEWDQLIDLRETPRGQQIIDTARDLYTDSSCDIEIDDGTFVYHNGENGHWVMAWAFVPDDEPEETAVLDSEDDQDESSVTVCGSSEP